MAICTMRFFCCDYTHGFVIYGFYHVILAHSYAAAAKLRLIKTIAEVDGDVALVADEVCFVCAVEELAIFLLGRLNRVF